MPETVHLQTFSVKATSRAEIGAALENAYDAQVAVDERLNRSDAIKDAHETVFDAIDAALSTTDFILNSDGDKTTLVNVSAFTNGEGSIKLTLDINVWPTVAKNTPVVVDEEVVVDQGEGPE